MLCSSRPSSLGAWSRLLQDESYDLAGDPVGRTEKRSRHDHETDHDAGGLHHLTTIGPLYPLQLAPASLQKPDEPRQQVLARLDVPGTGDGQLRSALTIV